MAMTKKQKLEMVYDEALTVFDSIIESQGDERIQCLADRRFYSIAGAQWEGDLGDQFENKPKFEVNKIHLSVIRIINEYRNNRITVDFVSKDGSSDDQLASVCDGLYRADEHDSCAQEAYDNAFEEAVGGGFGAWRLRADYEDEYDEDNDYQRIYIEPVFDADSCVFFDNSSKRQDKSDAKWGFILTSMSEDEYIEEYGDDPSSWDQSVNLREFDWSSDEGIFVAECYKKEDVTEKVIFYTSLDGEETKYTETELNQNPDLVRTLESTGSRVTKERKVKRQKVHKYIMSGGGVLEDCGIIAGKHIPIVPVYGKRWYVDNKERCMGQVRLPKDMQRLMNMQISLLAEISSYSPVQKPILTSEQIVGHENMWATDNIDNNPYLLINQIEDLEGNIVSTGVNSYTKPPDVPSSMTALFQLIEIGMKDILGNQQAGEQITPNVSGKALELIQNKLDMQSFIYMSNFAKAMQRSGEIWLSMAKDVMVEKGRKLKVIGSQGEIDQVELNKPVLGEKGEIIEENDITKANFDLIASVGPSSLNKKQSTIKTLMSLMATIRDEETLRILSFMVLLNMEGEGIEEVKEFFRSKLVEIGAVKPTKQELEEERNRPPSPPDPNSVYLTAAAEAEEAKAAKARADTVLTIAKAEETHAKTAEILSGMDMAEQKAVMEMAERMRQNSG